MSQQSQPTPEADIAALLNAAIARHQEGDASAAAAGYRVVLEKSPNHAQALYLSGALCYQSGDLPEALKKLERAVDIAPHFLPAVEMLGVVAAKSGQLEQSARCFAIAAAQKQTSPEAHYNAGQALFNLQRYAEAAEALRCALTCNPDFHEALYLLAVSLRLEGKLPEAAAVYQALIKAQPNNAHAFDELGGVLFTLDRIAEAEATLRRAIALAPNMANPYTNLGRILQTDPARATEALQLHDRAIALKPDYAHAHNNRGVALYTLGRYPEAITSYAHALTLKPSLAEASNNLGTTHYKIGHTREAIKHYAKAIAVEPQYAEAHWNNALALLTMEDWREGWTEYEWRWKCKDFSFPPRPFHQPLWKGEDLNDGSLLVWGEQGIGDEVLYGAMVGDLLARGIAVVWEADARLLPLIARSYPTVKAVARSTPPDAATSDSAIGAHIPAASLGQYLRATDDAFTRQPVGYFKPDAGRAQGYQQRLLQGTKKRLVGVSWISKNPEFGLHKSMTLADLAPLWAAAGPDVQFVDLQYGDTAAERTASGLDLAHLGDLDLFEDIDGLAALIAACDAVVSVSNTTAHLAGALGVPVTVLVAHGNGKLWYWGADRTHARWYPRASIIKQSVSGDWRDTIKVAARHIAGAP